MEDNEVMIPESQDTPETEADFDEGWTDEDDPFGGVDQTDKPDVQPEEPKAEPEEDPKPVTPVEPKEQPAQATPPEMFTIKNRDETRQVSREELIAMAQKGWDYDVVRADRDQLRAYKTEAKPAMMLVRAAATKSGMTVPEYLDYVRKQELMQTGINEATAQAQVNIEKQRAAIEAAQAEQRKAVEVAQRQKAEEDRRAEERRAEIRRFQQTFPDVKGESIPSEVWEQVKQGIPLTAAFALYRSKTLEAELAAERQNKQSREKSPGSMTTAGEKVKDIYDDGWYDD